MDTKSVLITGGAGFIGSHLAETLLEKGCCVTVIDDLSTGRMENITHLSNNPRFRFVQDSIHNQNVMDILVSQCQILFHLAASVGVKLIIENPIKTIQTNVTGCEIVLKTALRYRVKTLITSSSEVYGKGNGIPFREDDDVVLGSTSHCRWSYAASKMTSEFLALAYYQEQGLPVIVARLFNTIGPRQTGQYGMVVPRFVDQALARQPLTVYGDGEQTRCFLHVLDAVDALLALSNCHDAEGQVVNVGSTEEIKIIDLAKKILKLVDMRLRHSTEVKEESNRICLIPYEKAYKEGFEDMRKRLPDISKIKQLTGWTPRYSLNQIIYDMINKAGNAN